MSNDTGQGLVRVGALWKSDENKKSVATGAFGNAKLIILENRIKRNDRDPDWGVYIANKTTPNKEKYDYKKNFKSKEGQNNGQADGWSYGEDLLADGNDKKDEILF